MKTNHLIGFSDFSIAVEVELVNVFGGQLGHISIEGAYIRKQIGHCQPCCGEKLIFPN